MAVRSDSVRLTAAQALVRFLACQKAAIDGAEQPLFGGVWAIFGHGNVAGLGEALSVERERLATFRGHNEQSMGHAAIGFAKATHRRRMMAVTTSIGPGATNLVTAAATAHVNRLPVLLLPADVFASREPDPVLQQLETPPSATISVNDALKPVSRYWDRITRPQQLITALPEAMRVLTDPAECGPVTLALPQDVQAEAYDFPAELFETRIHTVRRPQADPEELKIVAASIAGASRPLLVAGGGVHYSGAWEQLERFASAHGVPVAETQAGKGSLPWQHPLQAGSIGVTGSEAANELAREADLIIAVGTRLSDFTSASRTLFETGPKLLVSINVASFDARKHGFRPLVADARDALQALSAALSSWRAAEEWTAGARDRAQRWRETVDTLTRLPDASRLPSDAQIIGAVQRSSTPDDAVVCAAGGMPGELHKLWRTVRPGGYHAEYGYSTMGYEIAGGIGVRMARTGGEVYVVLGDGSYLMANSEIATAVAMRHKLIIVLADNHGFGSINRLQQTTTHARFNNLLEDIYDDAPSIDFVAHAAALGARSERAGDVVELEAALERAREATETSVIVIETDPHSSTEAGGAFWDVPVAETSPLASTRAARTEYESSRRGARGR